MATLSHFLTFPSLFTHRHNWQQLQQHHSPHKFYRFRASSIKKSRKVKTNAELCEDIREFVAATGLPEGYVPTMKEFSQHGRSDLAYIVRRRGYKVVGELLGSGKETVLDGSNVEKADGNKVTGQYEEPNTIVGGDCTSSVEIPSNRGSYNDNLVSGGNSLLRLEASGDSDNDLSNSNIEENTDSSLATDLDSSDVGQENPTEANLEVNSHVPIEVSAGLENDSASLRIDEEEDESLEAEPSIIGSHLASSNIGPTSYLGNHSETQEKHVETSTYVFIAKEDLDVGAEVTNVSVESTNDLPSEEATVENGHQEKYNNPVEEVALSTEVFIAENLPRSASASVPGELSDLSLEEKAASFIQNGNLDTVEENSNLMLKNSGIEATGGSLNGWLQIESKSSLNMHLNNVLNAGKAATNFKESALQSMQVATAMNANNLLRDDNLSVEQQSTQFSKDPDDKTSKREIHVEVNHLKFMLYEKELELSRLKQKIETEKRALSLLQAKAETEIRNAQKLIAEKDAELRAAEEMLSELVEVLIQYHGDGEFVEVAGSFNGWHHWIKMDPQPSSNITDNVESRKSKLWSTVLWLYPGIYEIKFIVDGEWKNDPTMELVSHGSICNNLLRVSR